MTTYIYIETSLRSLVVITIAVGISSWCSFSFCSGIRITFWSENIHQRCGSSSPYWCWDPGTFINPPQLIQKETCFEAYIEFNQLIPLLSQFVAATQPINALAFVFDGVNFGASDFAYSAYSMVYFFRIVR